MQIFGIDISPTDDQLHELLLVILFFGQCACTVFVADYYFKMSDEDYEAKMKEYGEEGRNYAEYHWGGFKNKISQTKKEK